MARSPLMTALGFDDEDLRANRQGLLSASQRQKVRQQRLRDSAGQGLLALLALGLLGFLLVDGLILRTERAPSTVTLVLAAALLLFLVAGVPLVAQWQRHSRDLAEGQVKAVSGQVTPGITYRRRPRYLVRVGGLPFEVPPQATEVFAARRTFRVYYTPHARVLLSAEALPEGQARAVQAKPAGDDHMDTLQEPHRA